MEKNLSKKYIVEKFKTKEEWKNARGLGGTSVSSITGSSTYKNILELYAEIVSENDLDVKATNESMSYGILCEPIIRKLYSIDFAKKYKVHTPRNFQMYRRKDKKYMTATVDGTLMEINTKIKGIWECKTHDIKNHEDELEWRDHIPQRYYEQVIWYLVVLNDFDFVEVTAKLNFYDYFDSQGKKLLKSEIRYYHIERKDVEKDVTKLEKIVTRFWEKNVCQGIIPEMKITF